MQVDETREEYVGRFEPLARDCLGELLVGDRFPALVGGDLELFCVRDEGERTLAETRLTFRGLRFAYRRQIWPPGFPLELQVSLYVEHLRERLLTGRHPAPSRPGATVVL